MERVYEIGQRDRLAAEILQQSGIYDSSNYQRHLQTNFRQSQRSQNQFLKFCLSEAYCYGGT